MCPKKLLIIVIASALAPALWAEIIPLDSLTGDSWVLTTGEREKTIPDYIGRSLSWGVKKAGENEAKWLNVSFDPALTPFGGGASGNIITEMSPAGAVKNPAFRKFNLPELLDQLDLERALPDGVEKVSSSDMGLTLFITKPTTIAVSFSTFRPVKIINKSYLVLICPACDSVSLENESDKAVIDFYSFKCITAPYGGKFNRYVYTVDHKAWLAPCAGGGYDEIEFEKLPLDPKPWLPQLYVSFYLGRRPDELLKSWLQLYTTTLSVK